MENEQQIIPALENKSKRKIIVTIVILIVIILIGLGEYFYFDSKDGVGLAPSVTSGITQSVTSNGRDIIGNSFVISIAGFLGDDYNKSLDYMKEAGATGVRFMSRWGGMYWGQVEAKKGVFDWSKTDAMYLAAKEKGLNIMVTMYPGNPAWDGPASKYIHEYPTDMDEYLKFVGMAAERYDGDGVNDAPGSPVVYAWALVEEIERGSEYESSAGGNNTQYWWNGTPAQYADMFVKTYYAIKGVSPDAIVMTYGANNYRGIITGVIEKVTKPVLTEIQKLTESKQDFSFNYSLHYYNLIIDPLTNYIANIEYTKNMLAKIGLSPNEIVIEDMAPFLTKTDPLREKKLAKSLVASYMISFANGLSTVGWAQLSDGFEYDKKFEAGIISNPEMKGHSNDFRNLGFYSYKLMTEKLTGVDFANIIKVQEANEIYIYKFNKAGENIWVAWNDNSGTQQVTISGVSSTKVKVTEAVPKYASGKEVIDYNSAFNTETKSVSGGKFNLTLGETPVYIEEI